MKYDAFGTIHFKDVTEDNMSDITSMLDGYFLEHKIDNVGDNNNTNEYVVNSAVDMDTLESAIKELLDTHADKISYLNISWRESEDIKEKDNDETRVELYSRSVDIESVSFDNPATIKFKEEKSIFSRAEGLLFG